MLAKNANDNAYFLNKRGAFEFFASKLAPTGGHGLPPSHIFDRVQTYDSTVSQGCGSHRFRRPA
ncbi:hypothetical protein CER19_21115 [Pseudomonas sp. GL93]|nr:hypothetical protein CER19_21115 [Pseudomonas sp. GL93]